MLHLLKLCVGCASVEQLADWIAGRQMRGEPVQHHTRNMPRRAAEILSGGSLYWVIQGQIRVRQKIVSLLPGIDEGGRRFCRIGLDPVLVRIVESRHRPIQGWRYLEAAEAPADQGGDQPGSSDSLAVELRGLGLL